MEKEEAIIQSSSGGEKFFHGEFPKPKRQNFGPGELGQKAYDAITGGAPCESIIGRNDKGFVTCGNPAVKTVDIYYSSVTDIAPVCGPVHEEDTKGWMIQQAEHEGRARSDFELRTNGFLT